MQELYKVEDVARYFGVSPKTVRRWLREKLLKGFKPGGRDWRIKEMELERFSNRYDNDDDK